MRGKVAHSVSMALRIRITPAHAGKSLERHGRTGFSEDHPRPCGEKVSCLESTRCSVGSPPPMRGKVPFRTLPSSHGRITPAHAGKSGIIISPHPRAKDHPRPCGEKPSAVTGIGTGAGSPPPMRGKDGGAVPVYPMQRITPAHAGKSSFGRYFDALT